MSDESKDRSYILTETPTPPHQHEIESRYNNDAIAADLLVDILSGKSQDKMSTTASFFNPELIEVIADINIRKAVDLIQNENEPRLDILAQLLVKASKHGITDVPVEEIINEMLITVSSPYYDTVGYKFVTLAKASLTLREVNTVAAEKLFARALMLAQSLKGVNSSKIYISEIVTGQIVEAVAEKDTKEALALFNDLHLVGDISHQHFEHENAQPLLKIINSYLKDGKIEEAFEMCEKYKSSIHFIAVGPAMAQKDFTRFKTVLETISTNPQARYEMFSPETVANIYCRIAEKLVEDGDKISAQLCIEEALKHIDKLSQKTFSTISPSPYVLALMELVKPLAGVDFDKATSILTSVKDNEQVSEFYKSRCANTIVAAGAHNDLDRALELYKTTKLDSNGKLEAIKKLVLESIRQRGIEATRPLLHDLDMFPYSYRPDTIQVSYLAELSKYDPAGALTRLEKYVAFINENSNTRTIAHDIYTILDNNSLSVDEKMKWIERVSSKGLPYYDKESLYAKVLRTLLSESTSPHIKETFDHISQVLDPEKSADVQKGLNLLSSGLYPEITIDSFLQSTDPQKIKLGCMMMLSEIENDPVFRVESIKKVLVALNNITDPEMAVGILNRLNIIKSAVAGNIQKIPDLLDSLLPSILSCKFIPDNWLQEFDEYLERNKHGSYVFYIPYLYFPDQHTEIISKLPRAMAAYKKGLLSALARQEPETMWQIRSQLIVAYNVDPEIAYGLTRAGKYYDVKKYRSHFSELDTHILLQVLINRGDFDDANKLNESVKPHVEPALTKAKAIFGELLSPAIFGTVHNIYYDHLGKAEKELGITKNGDQGLDQLKRILQEHKSHILNEDFDFSVIGKSGILLHFFAEYVRYNSSEWGNHNIQEIPDILRRFETYRNQHKILPLDSRLVKSDIVYVNDVNKDKQKAFKFSEACVHRYKSVKSSIIEAKRIMAERKPYTHCVAQLNITRDTLVHTLQNKLATVPEGIAKKSIQQRIDILSGLNLRDLTTFQENFRTLSQFSEFHEMLRQLVFIMALSKNKSYHDNIDENLSAEDPTFDEISYMTDFLGHIVNETLLTTYFPDKKAAESFMQITNVKSFQEELSRAQKQETIGTVPMQFIPTRGSLLEFSGQIGDACWASMYNCIGKEFPNLSCIVLVQHPGTKHERLVGSCMIMDTKAEDGTPLLVIRGLNPIQNVINRLSIDDFYYKFIEYVQQLASSTNKKLAIVIDNESGGACTNRPLLFDHIYNNMRPVYQPVTLSPHEDTVFNNIPIANKCYLVS